MIKDQSETSNTMQQDVIPFMMQGANSGSPKGIEGARYDNQMSVNVVTYRHGEVPVVCLPYASCFLKTVTESRERGED